MTSLLLALVLAAQQASTGTPPPAASADVARDDITVNGRACVVVDVAGERAGVLDCTNRDLDAAARLGRAKAAIVAPRLPHDVRSNPHALGLANTAATRNRLGNQWGKGTRPLPVSPSTGSSALPRRN